MYSNDELIKACKKIISGDVKIRMELNNDVVEYDFVSWLNIMADFNMLKVNNLLVDNNDDDNFIVDIESKNSGYDFNEKDELLFLYDKED